tara:strand:- start:1987 stop:2235 length:249 start_codon:yes stop_codon:yes gene_type:complete
MGKYSVGDLVKIKPHSKITNPLMAKPLKEAQKNGTPMLIVNMEQKYANANYPPNSLEWYYQVIYNGQLLWVRKQYIKRCQRG